MDVSTRFFYDEKKKKESPCPWEPKKTAFYIHGERQREGEWERKKERVQICFLQYSWSISESGKRRARSRYLRLDVILYTRRDGRVRVFSGLRVCMRAALGNSQRNQSGFSRERRRFAWKYFSGIRTICYAIAACCKTFFLKSPCKYLF